MIATHGGAVICIIFAISYFVGGIPASGIDLLTNLDPQDEALSAPMSATRAKRGVYKKGENMDRGLGFGKKKDNGTQKKTSPFPWDPSSAQGKVRPEETEKLKSFKVDGEEPFPEGYYDDYDFEFPKFMEKNGNFEDKYKAVMEIRKEEEDMKANGNTTED